MSISTSSSDIFGSSTFFSDFLSLLIPFTTKNNVTLTIRNANIALINSP